MKAVFLLKKRRKNDYFVCYFGFLCNFAKKFRSYDKKESFIGIFLI